MSNMELHPPENLQIVIISDEVEIMAAPTIVRTGNFIEITDITADILPRIIFQDDNAHVDHKIKRIEFIAGADNDKCVIRMDNESGATICTLGSADVQITDKVYFRNGGQYMKPFIDFSDGVFQAQAGHKLTIEVA